MTKALFTFKMPNVFTVYAQTQFLTWPRGEYSITCAHFDDNLTLANRLSADLVTNLMKTGKQAWKVRIDIYLHPYTRRFRTKGYYFFCCRYCPSLLEKDKLIWLRVQFWMVTKMELLEWEKKHGIIEKWIICCNCNLNFICTWQIPKWQICYISQKFFENLTVNLSTLCNS